MRFHGNDCEKYFVSGDDFILHFYKSFFSYFGLFLDITGAIIPHTSTHLDTTHSHIFISHIQLNHTKLSPQHHFFIFLPPVQSVLHSFFTLTSDQLNNIQYSSPPSTHPPPHSKTDFRTFADSLPSSSFYSPEPMSGLAPLSQIVGKLVTKWSFELLHKAKSGDPQAAMQVAQIQFTRRGWGCIKPDTSQACDWVQHYAYKGDTHARNARNNLQAIMDQRAYEIQVAREHGLFDPYKVDANGKQMSILKQLNVPPIDFSKVITHNQTNNLEATSEEEIFQLARSRLKPLAQIIDEHRQKLIAEGMGDKLPKLPAAPKSAYTQQDQVSKSASVVSKLRTPTTPPQSTSQQPLTRQPITSSSQSPADPAAMKSQQLSPENQELQYLKQQQQYQMQQIRTQMSKRGHSVPPPDSKPS